MKIEPNLKDWADALIHGITGSDNYNPKLVKWVEAELNDIADKYYQMGFEDGDKDGWWKEQDKQLTSILDKEYEEAQKEIDKGKPVAGMYHCQCYRINKLAGNYNQNCWRCDGNY